MDCDYQTVRQCGDSGLFYFLCEQILVVVLTFTNCLLRLLFLRSVEP